MQVSIPPFLTAFRIFRSRRFWLVLLLLVAWALRLYHLGTMSLWWDESLSWDRATSSLAVILSNTIQIQNIPTHDLHPPFYFVLLHFVVVLAGTTEFVLRILSAGANMLTLAMFVPLTRLLFGRRGNILGWLTVLFATLSPFYVWYSQEARPYGLALFLSMFTLYALLRWCKSIAAMPAPVRLERLGAFRSWWFGLFMVGLAISFATLYLSFVLLPFYAVTILLFGRPDRFWRCIHCSNIVDLNIRGKNLSGLLTTPRTLFAGLLVIGFGLILIVLPRETDITSWEQAGPSFVPLAIMLRDVWNSFSIGLSMRIDQAVWLDLVLLALWLVGIFSLVQVQRRDARLALFLFAYMILPALAIYLGSYVRPLYLNSRHLITTSPAFYMGLAVGVDALARNIPARLMRRLETARPERSEGSNVTAMRQALVGRTMRRQAAKWAGVLVGVVCAGVFVGGALVSLNNLYFDETFAKDDHKAWAEFLRGRLRPDDYVILVAPQAEKIVEYYAPHGMQWESLPHLGKTQQDQQYLDLHSILDAYRNHARVWLLELHEPVADPTLHITDLLKGFGVATDEIIFRGISTEIRLQSFLIQDAPLQKPRQELPQTEQILFARNMALTAFEAPASMEAGAHGVVKLYWQLHRKATSDVNVSLQVVDEQGTVWGQWDAPPIGSKQPLTTWESGQTYFDAHDLIVAPGAPPGKYFIELGVYSTTDNKQWVASRDKTGLDTPVRLAEIAVTRPNPPRDPKTLVIDQHTDVSFGAALHFVGYDVEDRDARPGSAIPLTLYFQVAQTGTQAISGHVAVRAPGWAFWNRARAETPFTLDLAGRMPGDIVQATVNMPLPGDAVAGNYVLRLALDGLKPQTFLPADAYTMGAVHINAVARSRDLPPIAHPLQARFGDSIELLGYDLAAPQPLKPNAPVKLTLYWHALKISSTSYKVFTHLVNKDGKIYGQRDQFPLDGARPTTSWASGEIFTDVYQFDVAPDAPPGAYKIEIGFYNPADNTRLPAVGANGNTLGDHVVFEDLTLP